MRYNNKYNKILENLLPFHWKVWTKADKNDKEFHILLEHGISKPIGNRRFYSLEKITNYLYEDKERK